MWSSLLPSLAVLSCWLLCSLPLISIRSCCGWTSGVVVPASRTWMYHSLRKKTTTITNTRAVRPLLFQQRKLPRSSNWCCNPTVLHSATNVAGSSVPVSIGSSAAQRLTRRNNTRATTKMTATTTALRGGGGGGASAPAASAPAASGAPGAAITTNNAGCPKLQALRKKMHALHLDVYIVPSDDPHLSEYVPEAYKRRAYLSGFTCRYVRDYPRGSLLMDGFKILE